MRKHLLHTTALAAAAMLIAGGAVAADKKMAKKPAITVNGSFDALVGGILNEEQEVGGVDVATDTSAIDVRTDAEIHFNGRATLDNGLKTHMRVELEGQQGSGERIDEYYLSVSGSFGQIILGGTGGAAIKMLTGMSGSWATGVGETLNYDSAAWTPPALGNPLHTVRNVRLQDHDANKATYISPKLGGFQVGLTYSPNDVNDDDSDRINAEESVHNGLEGAISYAGKFGDVGFGMGVAMSQYQGGTENSSVGDQSDWAVVGRIDFGGGFRVSAAHKQTTDDADAAKGQITDVGARFVSGANSFSLVGSMGEMKDSGAQYRTAMGSYARSLGAGTKMHMNLIWNQSDNGMAGDAKHENTGMAVVTGLKVTF